MNDIVAAARPPSSFGQPLSRTSVRAYYEDTDAAGIVYYAELFSLHRTRSPSGCARSGMASTR